MSSRPRPEHLGRAYAERFRDQSVVDAYHFRPPYPEETFHIPAARPMSHAPSSTLAAGAEISSAGWLTVLSASMRLISRSL